MIDDRGRGCGGMGSVAVATGVVSVRVPLLDLMVSDVIRHAEGCRILVLVLLLYAVSQIMNGHGKG